jgi:hypothetical protein
MRGGDANPAGPPIRNGGTQIEHLNPITTNLLLINLRVTTPNIRQLVSTELNMHPQEYTRLRAASQAQSIDDETLLTSAQARAQVGGVSAMCLWRWTRDPR